MRRHLVPEEVTRAVTLLEEGFTQRYVAERLRVSQPVVCRLWNRYRELNTFKRRPGSGRQKKTTPAEDRFLRLQAIRNRKSTARDLRGELINAHGTVVSTQTVRNRLREGQIRSRRPLKVPKLEPQHRRRRLQFAEEHANWQLRHWTPILFSDESRFMLSGTDGRVRVWRRRGERNLPPNLLQTVAYGGGSVMVWGGISLNYKTDLVIIRGRLSAERYIEEVVQNHILPITHEIGPDFMLMHDGASAHTARVTTHFLEDAGIQVMDWPPRSPDLNCIEHLWDLLDRRLHNRQHQPQTLLELEDALLEEWRAIPQDVIRRYIRSMPRRCRAVIHARGGKTGY